MKFHFWHTILSLFFGILVLSSIIWLNAQEQLPTWIPLSDFFLMALAIMRLVRLFTYDNITAFIRDWFEGHDSRTLAGSLGTLINCPWCTGLWFSFLTVFFYCATPYAWYVILILALSSLASFMQLLANLIGWSAELKKKEAQTPILPR